VGVGGIGVSGGSTSNIGVRGGSTSNAGVYGSSSSSNGVYGTSTSGYGIQGYSQNSIAIYGYSPSSNGVVGQNSNTDWSAAAISALSGGAHGLAVYAGGDIVATGDIQVSGEAYKYGTLAWLTPSDARIKKDVAALRLGLTQLKEVRPVTYKYNGLGGAPNDGREYVGVIAQELEKVFPSMVSSKKVKLHPEDALETDIKIVDPSAFTYLLINSVKEQQALIERQERRIAALERGRGLTASMLGTNGLEVGLALGLLPLGFVALRRRKIAKESCGD